MNVLHGWTRRLLVALLLAAMGVSASLVGGRDLMEAIRDRNGKLIGYLDRRGDRTYVRDANGALLGYSDGRATYDRNGKRLLNSPQPAFLLKCR